MPEARVAAEGPEQEDQHKGHEYDRQVSHSIGELRSLCPDDFSVEKKEQALKKMLATVLKDKSMIQGTIVQLDEYKRDALLKTWEKVNG